jgi:hypothetical protein
MAEAVGPVYAGGFEVVASTAADGKYHMLFLPDKHNEELQAEGKAPVYYWVPAAVRIARRGDSQDYKFHLIHFVGVQSEDTTVGVQGKREVAGGVMSVTTTAAPPLGVLEDAHNQLMERFRGDGRRYWGWRTPATPRFAPIPIVASRTTITNLSPNADGSIPAASTPATGAPGSGAAAPGGAPGGPRSVNGRGPSMLAPHFIPMPRTIPLDRDTLNVSNARDALPQSSLDAWYWNLQGQGPGSIDPAGENAFSGLVGSLPTAILWQGFHGAYSPISVVQALKLAVWSETVRIKITGHWDRIFEHFSAAAQGKAFFWSADIKVEFNNLRINGGIHVDLEIDGTIPGADKMKEAADKRIDLILNKFMEQAKTRIFDPAPPEVKPAEASGGGGILSGLFGGYGGGFALKYRRDETHLDLEYDETVSEKYILDDVISSTLEGFYNEIKSDPDAEKKYFTTIYLDDWDRKVRRIVKPVVNWPDKAKQWVGDPVAFVSAQIGYPSAAGDIQWVPHVFQSTDTADTTTWIADMAKKSAADVSNPPSDWTPDKTFVKREVHFTEPPGETDYPFVRCFVEKNVVQLDPSPTGSLVDTGSIEVRADSVGKLEVGPLSLNVNLEGPAQEVEVAFQAKGKTDDGNDRPITKFLWQTSDQNEPRYWEIFTGQLDFRPEYRYQVHVVVKGGLFTKGMEWFGPWVDAAGNGPLVVSVPAQDDPNVTSRAIVRKPFPLTRERQAAMSGPPSTPHVGVGRPPSGGQQPAPVGAPPRNVPAPVGVGAPTGAREVSGYALPPPAAARSRDVGAPPGHGGADLLPALTPSRTSDEHSH